MKIAFDLGRSGLRQIVNGEDISVEQSSYKEIPVKSQLREDGSDSLHDFTILQAPNEDIRDKRYVKGDTMNFHKGLEDGADNTEHKAYQTATYINIAYSIARALINNNENSSDTINLGLCIPTAEFYSDEADILKQKLEGKYEVYFNLLEQLVTFTLHADNILITAEGVIASYPLVAGKDKSDLVRSNVTAIIDAGFGSTDITLLINGKPMGRSARSFPMGGIVLEANISAELEKARYSSSKSNVKSAIVSGTISSGSKTIAVGKIVQKCKQELAEDIVKKLLEVLNLSSLSNADVACFLPIGRCFTTAGEGESYTGDLYKMISEAWNYDVTKIELPQQNIGTYSIHELSNVLGVSAILCK